MKVGYLSGEFVSEILEGLEFTFKILFGAHSDRVSSADAKKRIRRATAQARSGDQKRWRGAGDERVGREYTRRQHPP